MNLYKRAFIASGILFGSSWLTLQLFQKSLDDIITIATLEALESKEIKNEILQYLNKILHRTMKDANFRNELLDFYLRCTHTTVVENALRDLIIVTLTDNETFINSIVSANFAFQLNYSRYEKKTIHEKIEKTAFKWKGSRINSLMVPLHNLQEQVSDTKFLLNETLFDPNEVNFSKKINDSLISANKAHYSCFNENLAYLKNFPYKDATKKSISSVRKAINSFYSKKKQDKAATVLITIEEKKAKRNRFIN